VNVPLAVAAALALLAAAIHSGVGEVLVLRKLPDAHLAPTRFGGPAATKLMIRVSWHLVGTAFLAIGVALGVCSSSGSAACPGAAYLAAASFAGFFVVAAVEASRLGLRRMLRMMVRHPAPVVFAAVAVLAWLGSK